MRVHDLAAAPLEMPEPVVAIAVVIVGDIATVLATVATIVEAMVVVRME